MTADPILTTSRLVLRNWQASDGDLFHEINSDPDVMEFFPWRFTRQESDEMLARVLELIGRTGFGFYAVTLRETGETIGFCGLSPVRMPGIFPEGTIEIGWRIATRHQGKGYVTEAAAALIDHAFADRGLDEVVSFAVEANVKSTAVMKRIHLRRDASRDFDHPRVPQSHPHLVRHVFYAITREQWLRDRATQ